ncbi:extracellular solute-binding protein [Paenibacillus thermotolerans]|uniref:extracellular solute-binding protein n=1 Tax=Paenibacillus thermotolerans TaxID=3027807 RepID=UPI00236836A9|nr:MULTISPECIES: extracellular solute-binding protein [unclassified Paenibacillus]
MGVERELRLFYCDFGGDPDLKPIHEAVRRFEEEHPGVRVKVHYQNRLAPSVSLQEVNPDVFFMLHGDFGYARKIGYAADLRPFFQEKGVSPADFVPKEILDLLVEEGELTAVPVAVNIFGAAYDKKLLDKAGIQHPNDRWTWEHFAEITRELQHNNQRDDFFGAALILHLDLLENVVMSNGGSYLSPDGSRASGYMNGKASVEAISWAVDFVRKHKLSPNTGSHIPIQAFNEGKVGLTINRHEELRKITPEKSGRVGFVGLPHWGEGNRAMAPILYGFGVSAHTKHPDLAFELLCELTITDNAFIREEARRPQITLLRESDAELNRMQLELKRAMESQYPDLRRGAFLANRHWFGSIWSHMLEPVLHGGASVQDVLNDIAAAVDRHLLESENH